MLLEKKFAVITGCNRGIGKSILELFTKNGCNIIACIRKENDDFKKLSEELSNQYNVQIIPIYFDLENDQEIKKGVTEIQSLKIPIDILINNSGIASGSLFQMTSINVLEKVMKINFFSQIYFTQGVSKIMIKNKKGSIINITSVAGIIGDAGTLSYGSSKAAMNFATKTIATELGKYNIRVNSIAPSITKTDMFQQMTEASREKMINQSALNRYADPEEIASCALYLASDQSSFITGQIIRLDGGII